VAGLVGGTQPVFDTVVSEILSRDRISFIHVSPQTYLDPLQKHIPLITLSPPSSSLLSQSSSSVVQNPTRTKRYTESDNLHLQTGHQQQPESMETDQVNDGELDVENDLAEISLGERLRIREEEMNGANGTIPRPGGDSSSASSAGESDDEDPKNASTSHNLKKTNPLTLTRLLAQSLHTSDTALLSSILTPLHSETIVLETVKRLQPQLALSLLGACVERIGKGGRAAGRWIRAVLVVHAGYLMSVRDV
jgi:U3 small nucleolar RNA-associated protein 5